MPIFFDCICGTEIEALDGQAGRKLMCPSCRSDLTVPPRTTAVRPEVIPDLGIDTAPRLRLYPKRRPSSRPHPLMTLLVGACQGTVMLFAGSLVLVLLALFVGGPHRVISSAISTLAHPAPASPLAYPTGQEERDDADDRARVAADATDAEDRAWLANEEASRTIAQVKRGAVDRVLWRTATPEGMALAWANRVRPADYRVKSARKLMFVLIAFLEDRETGREYGLKAVMDPDSDVAELSLLLVPTLQEQLAR
jgi:hypothetical protein